MASQGACVRGGVCSGICSMTSRYTYVFTLFPKPQNKLWNILFEINYNMCNTCVFSPQKDFRIKFLILWVDLSPENCKGVIAVTIFAFANQLPNFLLFMFFHVTPTFSSHEQWVHIKFKKSWKAYLAAYQFHDDEWWLQGLSMKTLLQCHYNIRWGWGKQFQCNSMETPLPDHYHCRLIEEQEHAEPRVWWQSYNAILTCQSNFNARHQIFCHY